ncbi:hypothetical protein [uncultured Desulfosarcina sp.]|uniref:hypothetical protein n=1 Tax=uncultured Desulfosarcina sp. TaxID=218289 RepID=UPI0029C97AA0|nr:hypothetical protein [uncultured Desulfosarcina sp.]
MNGKIFSILGILEIWAIVITGSVVRVISASPAFVTAILATMIILFTILAIASIAYVVSN